MDYTTLRAEMVEVQLRARGIGDERVLAAFGAVERHLFVPSNMRHEAYADAPLPIGQGQTISQPYMVALMTEALEVEGGERVLEVGTGSGYQAAILAHMGCAVHTVERNPLLCDAAKKLLEELGYVNIAVHLGDGTMGYPAEAPYDAILVTAGGPRVPESLKAQLSRDAGVLAMPVGGRMIQELVRVRRYGDEYVTQELGGCRFVPLVGEEGWPPEH